LILQSVDYKTVSWGYLGAPGSEGKKAHGVQDGSKKCHKKAMIRWGEKRRKLQPKFSVANEKEKGRVTEELLKQGFSYQMDERG